MEIIITKLDYWNFSSTLGERKAWIVYNSK